MSNPDSSRVVEFVNKVLAAGVSGFGPYKSATEVAEELRAEYDDPEAAIARLIEKHRVRVASSGFASGVAGFATLTVALPADVTAFHMLCARMSAAIAVLRGYDLDAEEVRTAILVSLLGRGAAKVLSDVGVEIGTAVPSLRELSKKNLLKLEMKVGRRLIRKFATKGPVRLIRGIPVVGGGVGAGMNAVALNRIAKAAKEIFVPVN
ncbi:hypothetical protein BST27_09680 [Mycobacterium intermedium]|uniref:EcsC family protein n=1 Tax=Mycobacterium intermedium TaxID=28445 RepID=A0A1E3SDD2_MYCIE|nr:EcsC family protein [Mycobacterium intermedium]MCV6966883.1 EcsC family protein [Mycobacterium intermedium]ODQ99672.1 hypothetical protein BHQ20_16120 [Mycobacterium intermedium]OPE49045.1 hypothetical protein BV508_15640 [Mycobacterium intermedium]ORB07178.1 hypothetical protein BST27_09680 [Mycobacterium intermedium]